MSDRIEHAVTTEQSTVVTDAMNRYFERLLALGLETAKNRACIDCTQLALCGIAINTLRSRKAGAEK